MEVAKAYYVPQQNHMPEAGKAAAGKSAAHTAMQSGKTGNQEPDKTAVTQQSTGAVTEKGIRRPVKTEGGKDHTVSRGARTSDTAVRTVLNAAADGQPADGVVIRKDGQSEEESESAAKIEAGREKKPIEAGEQTEREKSSQKEKDKEKDTLSVYDKVMAEKAMENAADRIKAMGRHARFSYNEEIARYTITDNDDKEVIKEIPSEQIQKMIEHLHTMRGMMMDEGF